MEGVSGQCVSFDGASGNSLMNKFVKSVFFCVSLSAAVQASHIDFIVDGGFLLTTSSDLGSATATQTGDPGNILGSEREVSLDFTSGTGFLTTGTLSIPAGPGPVGPNPNKVLLFDNSVSSSGTLTLTYDGVGNSGLGGIDFDTTWDSVDVAFNAVQGAGNLSLMVTDAAANSGTMSLPVNAAGVYSFPFADAAYAGVDLGSVDGLEFTLETSVAASDFSISQITREVVPEPSGLLLIVGGLLPLMIVRGRRRS